MRVRVILRRVGLMAVGAALLIAATVGVWQQLAADVTGPTSQDRQVTTIINSLMARQHVLKHPLNDEISQRTMKSFLGTLDPMKLFLYRSDVDEFMKFENQLDDMLSDNQTSFAYQVYHRYLKRLDERVDWALEFATEAHDYAADEILKTDFEKADYAATEQESRERWRKRIKYDLLVLKAEGEEAEEARDRIKRRYQSLKRRWHQLDNDELLELYLTAFTSSYDPHTTYMSASTLDNFRIALGLRLEGIGAQLKDEDGMTVVTKVIPGGAADKQGKLKTEDRIVSVGQGTEGEMLDVVNMKLNDVVEKIRGEAGTVVRLGVIPAEGGEQQIYSITRARIELADSAAKGKVFDAGKRADGSTYRIGVIDLPSFYMDMEGARNKETGYRSTTVDVRKILDDFKKKSVDAVVLDLRRNGGGSLTEAINLTGLFIDTGPVVQVKDPQDNIQQLPDLDAGMAWSGPLVVLTSKLSASASEILAGAIQDYRRGLIVGDENTFGKGTVQSLLDLAQYMGFSGRHAPNLGALKITMQQFYRPNGDSTQKRGVLADVVLPSLTTHMDVAESDLDYSIDFDRIPRADFRPLNMVSGDALNVLVKQSQSRRKGSDDFSELSEKIERYVAQKSKKQVTLNEEEYLAERKELDAAKEEEKELEEQSNPDDDIKRDFYLDEVFNITVDYVQELEKLNLAGR